ncbi:DNA-binding protein [Catenibacterium sp. RTP21428st1_D7_RTP21428_210409]|uniref:DNA-binding protein n=1 Tax=unclassified Catenibacterium TaxID=2643636 RepID=UPI0032EB74A5
MNDLQMITQEELTKLIHCSEAHVTFLRELGIIPAIKTGRNYMFSPVSIQNFFDDYAGLDVSNRIKAMRSKEIVESRKKSC